MQNKDILWKEQEEEKEREGGRRGGEMSWGYKVLNALIFTNEMEKISLEDPSTFSFPEDCYAVMEVIKHGMELSYVSESFPNGDTRVNLAICLQSSIPTHSRTSLWYPEDRTW